MGGQASERVSACVCACVMSSRGSTSKLSASDVHDHFVSVSTCKVSNGLKYCRPDSSIGHEGVVSHVYAWHYHVRPVWALDKASAVQDCYCPVEVFPAIAKLG